jgi:AcrR family transcriptional regulator
MDAIAERVGLTVGALYRHFDSKGALLLDVLRRALWSLPIAEHLRKDTAGADLLPQMVTLYTAPELRQLRRLAIEMHIAASRDRKAGVLLREFNEKTAVLVRGRIEAGRREGAYASGRDPDFIARLLMVLIMGLAHIDTLFPSLRGKGEWRDFVRESAEMLLGLNNPVKP